MRYLRQLAVLLAVSALLAFALAACSDDGDDGDAAPTATDAVASQPTDANGGGDGDDVSDALQIEVTSTGISFASDALEAAAGEDFRIVYANLHDGIPHSLAIFASEDDATGGGDPIAATAIKNGPDTQELAVAGLAAGEYFIWCEIHVSGMTATLTIE